MKNVIALGLLACAAFTSVRAEANVVNDFAMWQNSCSDHNLAWWTWLDKSNGYKKLDAEYNTPAWEKKDQLHMEYIDKCAQFMTQYDIGDDPEGSNRGMQAFHDSYVKSFEAKLKAVK